MEREGRERERGGGGREGGRRERRMQLTFQCVSLLHWVQPDSLSTHHDNTTMHRLVLVQLPHGLCSLQVHVHREQSRVTYSAESKDQK